MTKTEVIRVRLEPEMRERLDALARRMTKEHGIDVSRSAAIRLACRTGLDVLERKAGRGGRGRGRFKE
jgi:predicted DNA-binding protein